MIRRVCLYKFAILLALVAALATACGDGGSPSETAGGGSPTVAATLTGAGMVLSVAPDGDDTASGSVEDPWRTIQHAADSVLPGNTVVVQEGTYREEVTLARSGEAGLPISFVAASEGVVLDGGGALGGAFTVSSGTSHLRLEGFRLRDYRVWNISLEGSNRDIVIAGIDSSGGEVGIHMTLGEHGKPEEGPVEDVTIRDSEFHDHLFGGIDCTPGPCNDLRISNVSVHHNGEAGEWGADGIGVEMGADIAIEGCQVYENGGDGIDLNSRDEGPVSGIEVRGCQVWDNGRNGIKLWRGGTISDSLVHSMGSAGIDLARAGTYEIVNTLVARSGRDGDYGVVVAYPEESGPQGPVALRVRNSVFAFNNSGIYLGESVSLDEDYDLFFSREDCEIEAVFWNREEGCFSREEVASGAWLRETGNGGHSLTADPRFVDGEGGDYHLRPESPARDAGDPEQGGTPDLEGNQRPAGAGVDMGPYEAQ